MSIQPVLTCGIIRDASLYDHLRENATGERGGLSVDHFANRFEAGSRYSVWSGSRCIARRLFDGNAYREQSFGLGEPKRLSSLRSTSLRGEQREHRRALVSCDYRVDLPSLSYLLATCEKMGREESPRLSVKDPE